MLDIASDFLESLKHEQEAFLSLCEVLSQNEILTEATDSLKHLQEGLLLEFSHFLVFLSGFVELDLLVLDTKLLDNLLSGLFLSFKCSFLDLCL